MSLATWMLGSGPRAEGDEEAPPPAHDDFWYERGPDGLSAVTHAGVRVSVLRAMQNLAVGACRRIYGGTFAMLPAEVFAKVSEEERRHVPEHPIDILLSEEPNEYQTAAEFWDDAVSAFLLRGNFFAEKIPGPRGATTWLWPIGCDDVYVDWLDRRSGRRRVYDVASSHDGRARTLLDDQVWHLREHSLDGLSGLSRIGLHREAIGVAEALQVNAARFFGAGSRASVVLSSDVAWNEKTAIQNRKAWEDMHKGPYKSHRTAALYGGLKVQQLSMTNEDSQFLESRQYQTIDIAGRIFLIPPVIIGEQTKQTSWGSGVEQIGIFFRTYGLGPVAATIKSSVNKYLIRDRRFYFEHKLDAFLQTDIKSKFEAFAQSVNANDPWLLVNEIRRMLNLPPLPDGDKRRMPLNMGTGGAPTQQPQNGKNEHMEAAA